MTSCEGHMLSKAAGRVEKSVALRNRENVFMSANEWEETEEMRSNG